MTFGEKLNVGLAKVVERTMVAASISRIVQTYSTSLYKTVEVPTAIPCRASIGETSTVTDGANRVTTSTVFLSKRAAPGDVVTVGNKTLTVLTVIDYDVAGLEPVIFEVTAQ